MRPIYCPIAALLAVATSILPAIATTTSCPRHKGLEHLVVFGDSYTDNGLFHYISGHNDTFPPPGVLHPENALDPNRGLKWSQFAKNYTNAILYDYAVAGATCSNDIVARYNTGLKDVYPSVLEREIPKFESDVPTALYRKVNARNTVYAMWIGTNDLGTDAFLSDSQAPGTNLTSYIDCQWEVFDRIYQQGGRRFVVLNNNALQLAPMYQLIEKGGTGNPGFCNITEHSYKMLEYTVSTNRMIDYGVPFNLIVKKRWPRATFSVFNVHDLIVDIYNNPKQYLEPPYDVTTWYDNCTNTTAGCPPDRKLNSYLWHDPLHPSNITYSIVAKEFVKVVDNESKYGTLWCS